MTSRASNVAAALPPELCVRRGVAFGGADAGNGFAAAGATRVRSPLRRLSRVGLLAAVLAAAPASANGPWLPVGDASLRADVELLAAYGLIANLTTTWPIGHGQITRLTRNQAMLDASPPHVRAAATRVLAAVTPGPRRSLQLRFTDDPTLVRGFDTRARAQSDTRVVLQTDAGRWHATVSAGALTPLVNRRGARFAPDGTAFSMRLGNWRAYAGWTEHWQGGGQVTALSLSNNARPFPKLGVMRDDPRPFETPLLAWLGPWRLESFVGLLDGERRDSNTVFGSLRVSFAPLRGLEVGLARNLMFCGANHDCDLARVAFDFTNDEARPNLSNEQGVIDLRYTAVLGGLVLSPYLQHVNDDTGPFAHSYSSHLVGATLDGPWGARGDRWRLLVEFADTRATLDAFGFDERLPGFAYNNGDYLDGWRYRDRTIGASLDSDSKLLTLGARYTGISGLRAGLDYHHAQISSEPLAALQAAGSAFRNTVSPVPVSYNEFDASMAMPLGGWLSAGELSLNLRARDAEIDGGSRYNGELGFRLWF